MQMKPVEPKPTADALTLSTTVKQVKDEPKEAPKASGLASLLRAPTTKSAEKRTGLSGLS
jgi:hypothetical protein